MKHSHFHETVQSYHEADQSHHHHTYELGASSFSIPLVPKEPSKFDAKELHRSDGSLYDGASNMHGLSTDSSCSISQTANMPMHDSNLTIDDKYERAFPFLPGSRETDPPVASDLNLNDWRPSERTYTEANSASQVFAESSAGNNSRIPTKIGYLEGTEVQEPAPVASIGHDAEYSALTKTRPGEGSPVASIFSASSASSQQSDNSNPLLLDHRVTLGILGASDAPT